MKIVLLGLEGCQACAELEMDTINALSSLGISAELKHVTNPGEVREYKISVPAFIVDGNVKVVGRAPSFQEIKTILSDI